MKLTVIGGGSVRTPQLIPALIRRAHRLNLTELWLMDTDAEKLDLIGGLCRHLAADAPFSVHFTTAAETAIAGAHHVVTSIRPGGEQGRAIDERICFGLGVLGQETTGAAGFAMALRSIPAIVDYARMVREIGAPGAWLYNFTNPAGLVAQALQDAGFDRVLGICDSANGAQNAVSHHLGVPKNQVHHTVYGLNHLSWTPSVRVGCEADGSGGEEVFPALLGDPRFVGGTHLSLFAPGVVTWQRAFLNEYLHYFYHRDEALAALLKKPETRGEETLRLTRGLLERLRGLRGNDVAGLAAYHDVMAARGATYMAHARRADVPRPTLERPASPDTPTAPHDDEGYAGVVMNCITAIENDEPTYTGLNVPNQGAIVGLADDDVVEIGCWVDAHGVRPEAVGEIPPDRLTLMRSVKLYERLAAQAALTRNAGLAVQALTAHPLVGSYPLAERLVDAFLRAHEALIGAWRR
ncbi:MAG: hypothetical protein JNL73_00565 [Anaerolineales bacterium]|nr:hypothetical protein [Anaerolineales bacterium]